MRARPIADFGYTRNWSFVFELAHAPCALTTQRVNQLTTRVAVGCCLLHSAAAVCTLFLSTWIRGFRSFLELFGSNSLSQMQSITRCCLGDPMFSFTLVWWYFDKLKRGKFGWVFFALFSKCLLSHQVTEDYPVDIDTGPLDHRVKNIALSLAYWQKFPLTCLLPMIEFAFVVELFCKSWTHFPLTIIN